MGVTTVFFAPLGDDHGGGDRTIVATECDFGVGEDRKGGGGGDANNNWDVFVRDLAMSSGGGGG